MQTSAKTHTNQHHEHGEILETSIIVTECTDIEKFIPSLRFGSDTDTADNTFAYEKERTILFNSITPIVL